MWFDNAVKLIKNSVKNKIMSNIKALDITI